MAQTVVLPGAVAAGVMLACGQLLSGCLALNRITFRSADARRKGRAANIAQPPPGIGLAAPLV